MTNRKSHYQSIKSQQGVVMVVALFFVALAATMAYFMMARLERDTYRTQLLLRDIQAEFYAEGSIDWAMEQLHENVVKQKPGRPIDTMPIQSPVNEVNGYRISSVIYDMQARMNVNNVLDLKAQPDFQHLLQLADPDLNTEQAREVVLAIADWIRAGTMPNEYSQYYMSLRPPYRTAHKPMISTSELLLVKGMTPKLFKAIQPYITALPEGAKINVQTAPALVLATLGSTMTLETGKAIEKERAQKIIATPEAFKNLDTVKSHDISLDKIVVVSTYFLVETTVAIEKQKVVIYTLLERKDAQQGLNVIWQSKSVPTT